ncbi:MAG: GDP-mannose 4,6-dehydratase, partial [bacterium]
NGEQKRNFTYVSDVVDLTIKASETKDATGNVFNLANPNEVSVNYLADVIKKILGRNLKVEYLPPILGDCERNPADISRLKEILGFSPKIDFEEGIRRTIDWYQSTIRN